MPIPRSNPSNFARSAPKAISAAVSAANAANIVFNFISNLSTNPDATAFRARVNLGVSGICATVAPHISFSQAAKPRYLLKFQKIPSKLKTENMKKARKKISLSKLAEKLGLSKSSVSRALSGSPGRLRENRKSRGGGRKKIRLQKERPPFKGDVFRKERRRRRLRDNRLRQRKAGEGLLRQVQRDIQIRVGGERGRPPARIRRVRHMAARKKFHSREIRKTRRRARHTRRNRVRTLLQGQRPRRISRSHGEAETRLNGREIERSGKKLRLHGQVPDGKGICRKNYARRLRARRIHRGEVRRQMRGRQIHGRIFRRAVRRTASALFPRSIGKTPAAKIFQKSRNTRANTNSTRFSRIPPTSPK